VPPPQACYDTPHDRLCSSIPHDITEKFGLGYSALAASTQRPFDNFSWQSFVALNWPADKDGNPSSKPIGSEPTAPRVWEFYPTPFELFGQPLLAENHAPPALIKEWSGRKPRRLYTLLSTRSNPPDLKPDSFLEASSAKPLIDRNLNYVVYGIALNQIEFDYVKSNNLNTKSGQATFHQQGKLVSFPLGYYQDSVKKSGGSVGAIEIKTAWRILDEKRGDKKDRYYTHEGTVYIDADHSETGKPLTITATLGLVGFHIMQRTTGPLGFPQDWIWSTFEHIDNAPLAANARAQTDINLPLPNAGDPPAKVTQEYSFYNPDYKGKTNEPPPLGADKVYQWSEKPPYAARYAFDGKYGTQVVRCWSIFPATEEVNRYFQAKLAGTPWQYYQLIGTQWMGGVEDPKTENGNIPRYLSNTTLETYLQFSPIGSCLACHGSAPTAEPGLSGNFSFLLMRAR
jgi:hypothetical protein